MELSLSLSPHFTSFLNASLCDYATRLNKLVGTEVTNKHQASAYDVEHRINCSLAEINRAVAKMEDSVPHAPIESPGSDCSDRTADTAELMEIIHKHDITPRAIAEEEDELSPEFDSALDAIYGKSTED